ncbi:molybdopterin converting factor subunit 1 [Acetobacter pomorum]|uniref:Molybdopterin synthase sulfur carrier subunit n=1 Tax=Acetobacter pomorum TaxID=65959 RepID=A0A2G4RAJ0_9PROT|nr:molybdopterin converting factor subunit 1 [Acetobacter pomorum]PHY93572.1 molybdopterin converting factor subunit 1 [Acetobacter pomorum]GBR46280.1 molybdopterin converting factor small subunit MoeD [Acetobacter pomorum DSM 11825]
MTGHVNILYFAALREQLGRESQQVPLSANGQSVADLLRVLRQHDAMLDEVFAATPRIRVAVNQKLGGFDTCVQPGDELAFFPPMTGG